MKVLDKNYRLERQLLDVATQNQARARFSRFRESDVQKLFDVDRILPHIVLSMSTEVGTRQSRVRNRLSPAKYFDGMSRTRIPL